MDAKKTTNTLPLPNPKPITHNNMQLPKRKPGKYTNLPNDPIMSKSKYEELKRELASLKKKQPHASQEVSRLAELGDFSENLEYQLAKRRLRGILNAILRLDFQINHAEVVEVKNNNIVQIGSSVKIKTPKGEKTYTILGALEADPGKGIISHASPLGSALLGGRVGDVVEVERVGRCEIIKISALD